MFLRKSLIALVLAGVLSTIATAARTRPHVTLITDSVGASLGWDSAASRIFQQGIDADLELKGCRRLTTQSCPAGNEIPPNALELIRTKGRALGANVVINVGYNDYPAVYGPGIEEVLGALEAAHVEHVFWVTLHASRHPYVESNAAISEAAHRHPELTIIDWNAFSSGHPDWFGPDGVHLSGEGAQALARCMHDGVLAVLLAPPPPPPPPPIEVELDFPGATVTPGFAARLHATGGSAPYRFAVRGLPRGLHARRNGTVSGGSVASGNYTLVVSVRDSKGRAATDRVSLRVS